MDDTGRERRLRTWAVAATLAALLFAAIAVLGWVEARDSRADLDDTRTALGRNRTAAEVCRAAVLEARRFAEEAVADTEEVYDQAFDWIRDAYFFGTQGNGFAVRSVVARDIAEKQAFFSDVHARDIAFEDWLGWSGGPPAARNEAVECLGEQSD